MDENNEHSAGSQLQALRERVIKAEVHSERSRFITRFVVPLLSALVIGLFTWIWTTSQQIVQLRSDIEKASASAADRYTQTEADRDIPELRNWLRRVEDDLDEVRTERIPKMAIAIAVLQTKNPQPRR